MIRLLLLTIAAALTCLVLAHAALADHACAHDWDEVDL